MVTMGETGVIDYTETEPQSFECFHVTRQLPYSPPVPMTVGQTFAVGTSHNPFFNYYQNRNEIPVEIEGRDIMVPAIKFLEQIKSGQIVSDNLHNYAYDIANHYMKLARELLYEQVRLKEAPHLPSRQTCLWASVSQDEANGWMRYLGGTEAHVLRLQVIGQLHVADSNLLMNGREPLSETYQKASRYWRGDHSDSPRLELLVSGQVTIIEEIR
ncbi:DUF2441 domain-containing protein [Cereibacter changlensis]|uniref:DUF2441 domain-containing protein n=1 Tax=Cereibacter changlensis TaxID=402884 RepID=UPI0040335B7A